MNVLRVNQDNRRTEDENVPHVLARIRFIDRFFDEIVAADDVEGPRYHEL